VRAFVPAAWIEWAERLIPRGEALPRLCILLPPALACSLARSLSPLCCTGRSLPDFPSGGSDQQEQANTSAEMLSQSPVDIADSGESYKVEALSAAQVSLTLGTAEAELVNFGANFQVGWADKEQNFLVLDGKKYYTVQFHFHAPSTSLRWPLRSSGDAI
jgi:hypothetical protein